MNVYVGIGNTDNKLTQQEWAEFVREVEIRFDGLTMHGAWFSRPDAPWQNACWLVELDPATSEFNDDLKESFRWLAGVYNQDSIAWAEAETQFLGPSR